MDSHPFLFKVGYFPTDEPITILNTGKIEVESYLINIPSSGTCIRLS